MIKEQGHIVLVCLSTTLTMAMTFKSIWIIDIYVCMYIYVQYIYIYIQYILYIYNISLIDTGFTFFWVGTCDSSQSEAINVNRNSLKSPYTVFNMDFSEIRYTHPVHL